MVGLSVRTLMAGCLVLMIAAGVTKAAPEQTTPVFYRSVRVDGLSIFYREAGPAKAPIGATRYVLYLEDYGGPIGFRLALAHPERVGGMIIQNAVAHEDGLGLSWEARRQFWQDRAAHEPAFQKAFLSFETTRKRHIGSSPNVANYAPDLWADEFTFLSQPGETEIQTDLFYDYRTNEPRFAAWQAWMKEAQPPALVVWGRYDPSFETAEAQAYKRELPNAEIHVLDAGHFALDEKADDISGYIHDFLSRHTRQ